MRPTARPRGRVGIHRARASLAVERRKKAAPGRAAPRNQSPRGALQGNIANIYHSLSRFDEALRLRQKVYSGHLILKGNEHYDTLREANNYASLLGQLKRFKEAKALLRKMVPVARRVFGDNNDLTLKIRGCYAAVLYTDVDATLDDVREAVTTIEDIARTTRQVFGGEHPRTVRTEVNLRNARAMLRAREASSGAG